MKRVAVLLVLMTLAACGGGAPEDARASNQLAVYVVFANTPDGGCNGTVFPKKVSQGALVKRAGRIRWEQVGGCSAAQHAQSNLGLSTSNFRKRGTFGCSGENVDALFPVDPENARQRIPKELGRYCYDVTYQWEGKTLKVDPEIDVMQ